MGEYEEDDEEENTKGRGLGYTYFVTATVLVCLYFYKDILSFIFKVFSIFFHLLRLLIQGVA